MKPTLWRYGDVWLCCCLGLKTPSFGDVEDYCKWIAAAEGATMEEAYENWLEESERIKSELESE